MKKFNIVMSAVPMLFATNITMARGFYEFNQGSQLTLCEHVFNSVIFKSNGNVIDRDIESYHTKYESEVCEVGESNDTNLVLNINYIVYHFNNITTYQGGGSGYRAYGQKINQSVDLSCNLEINDNKETSWSCGFKNNNPHAFNVICISRNGHREAIDIRSCREYIISEDKINDILSWDESVLLGAVSFMNLNY